MHASTVAKHYGSLTPEERFRLIGAAGGRGDEAEQNRLRNAGRQITLRTSDHAPWARAFDELALAVFLEMVEEAAKHHDAFECWCDAEEAWSREHETPEGLVEGGPGAAFQPEGMLRWVSKIRPEGAPEPAMEDLVSPERFAADLDKVFRMRVAWWGG